jgi:histone-binding protein RBBP4
MVWEPTMRVWAGDEVKVDEKELETDAMEGVESTGRRGGKGKNSGAGSLRSQSMSFASVSGDD